MGPAFLHFSVFRSVRKTSRGTAGCRARWKFGEAQSSPVFFMVNVVQLQECHSYVVRNATIFMRSRFSKPTSMANAHASEGFVALVVVQFGNASVGLVEQAHNHRRLMPTAKHL